jgi:hypothetical protein
MFDRSQEDLLEELGTACVHGKVADLAVGDQVR